MKISKNSEDKVIEKLNVLWKKKICEVCQNKDWSIDNGIFEVKEYNGKNSFAKGLSLKPYLLIECNNCGNTKFLNARIFDLIDDEGNIK